MINLDDARKKLSMLDAAAGEAPLNRKTHVVMQEAVKTLFMVIEEVAMLRQQLEQEKTQPEPKT